MRVVLAARLSTKLLLAFICIVVITLVVAARDPRMRWMATRTPGGLLPEMIAHASVVKVVSGAPEGDVEHVNTMRLLGNDPALKMLNSCSPLGDNIKVNANYSFIVSRGIYMQGYVNKTYGYNAEQGLLGGEEGWYKVPESFRLLFLKRIKGPADAQDAGWRPSKR